MSATDDLSARDTFALMSRVRELDATTREQGRVLFWRVEEEPGVGPMLRMEVAITDADAEFIRQMRAMFAPLDPDDPRV